MEVGLLTYWDDTVLTEETQEGVKLLFSRLYKAALKVGLLVNEEKTEYTVSRKRDIQLCQTIKVVHNEF